jgi:hypothetical protein
MFQTVIASVAVSGSVSVSGGSLSSIGGIGSTVDVLSQGQLLGTFNVPIAGGGFVVPNIPPWVRVLYLLIDGLDDWKVDIIGQTSNVQYTQDSTLGADPAFSSLIAVPYAALLDASAGISLSPITGTGTAHLYVVAMPDAGAQPVLNIPDDALSVKTLDFADQLAAATVTLAVNTPVIIIPAPSGSQQIRLWHLFANNASGSAAIITFLGAAARLLSANVANGDNVDAPFYGIPIAGPGGNVQIESSVAGAVRYTAVYTVG